MLKHYFSLLFREEIDKLLIVLASLSSLVVALALSTGRPNWLQLLPVGLLSSYVVIRLVQNFKLARATYPHALVPFSVCLAKSREWYANAIREQEACLLSQGFPWNNIQKLYKIHLNDWTFHQEKHLGLISAEWVATVRGISEHFWRLSNRADRQPVYHLFFVAPTTVSIGMGATFGRTIPFVTYQHTGVAKKPYTVLASTLNLSTWDSWHMLTERVQEFELIQTTGIPPSAADVSDRNVIVVLDFLGHTLPPGYLECQAVSVVEARLKDRTGHIPIDTDWLKLAQEISSVILRLLDRHARVHLYPGVPAALGFIVGAIVGSHDRVQVYHYNRSDHQYVSAFSLGDFA
jgi:hypothetical protein